MRNLRRAPREVPHRHQAIHLWEARLREGMGAAVRARLPGVEKEGGMTELGDQSKKKDGGKALMHLLPWTELARDVVPVLEYGLGKYSEGGWRSVDNARKRYLNAALRHLAAYADGERLDPESGLHHVAHAACSVLFLLRFKDDA